MATLTISGDNSSYTLTLSGMSTSKRYHVFVADISSTGAVQGYYCRRSSLGTSSSWSYSGSSSSPYSQHVRPVLVRSTTSATSHVVGNYYSYSEVTSGTTAEITKNIPAAGSSTSYSVKCTAGTGISTFTWLNSTSSGTGTASTSKTLDVGSSSGYMYLKSFSFSSGYGYPVTVSCSNPTNSWTIDSATSGDHKISPPSGGGTRTATVTATKISETYTLHFNSGTGVSKFTYTSNGGSTVHTCTPPATLEFGTTKGYITLKSITLDSGYTYPVTAVADVGTTSWTIQSSSSGFDDATISCVDVTGKTANIRNVTISASKVQTNNIYFRLGTGISLYKMSYANASSTGNIATVSSSSTSTSAAVRRGTNASIYSVTYAEGYTTPYHFVEYDSTWSTVKKVFSDGDGNVYSDTSSATRYIKLFGTERTKYTHTLTYRGNPVNVGDQIRSVPTTQTITDYDTTYTFTISSLTPYPSDAEYTFKGWNTKADGTGTSYSSGASITVSDSITLYAQWNVPTEYSLSFNGNAISGEQIRNVPTIMTYTGYESSHKFTIPSNIPYPTSYTYVFDIWNANSSGTGVSYSPGGTITVLKSDPHKTIYAKWKDTIVTVSFHGNGGLWGSQSTKTVNITTGNTIYFSTYSSGLTRSGYRLLGWTDIDGSDIVIWGPNGSTVANTAWTDYYAIWEKIPYDYKLIFNPNGGYFYDYSTDPKEYNKSTTDESIDVPVHSIYVPSKTGNTFLGYSFPNETKKYTEGSNIPLLSSNPVRAVYAQWQVNEYTLTLDGNGGTFGPYVTVKPVKADYGEVIHLSEHKPTRAGYILLGWNPNQSATTVLYGPDDDYTMIYTDLRWYAIWQKKSIDEFNWTSADGTYIVTGQPVANILASKWNLLRGIIETISGTKPGTDVIPQVTPMTKTIFNTVRNAIAALPGASSVPSTVDTGDPIDAELFHTTKTLGSSLKKAINKAIDYYNTH